MTGFGYNISGFGGFANRNPTITRAVFGGGANTVNVIDFITIQTAGNASDFGDATVTTGYRAGFSGAA